jgi:RNA polymerase sigma factor (sigma-70 family)
MIHTPLEAGYQESPDLELISESVLGNKQALEKLVKRHQDYLYNISLRLFGDPNDAMDATQEVLIKMITSLHSFQGKSAFRTWLYRIALNHFLNRPKNRIEVLYESNAATLSGFAEDASDVVDEVLIEETRQKCATAMLLCLNREQRLLYIIGDVFAADHQLGASLFDLTPENYRIKLYRARKDLYSFVSGKCGILNPANACRCPKKTKTLIEKGIVQKDALQFNTDYTQKVQDILAVKQNSIADTIRFELNGLFQNSPFQVKASLDSLVNGLVREY